LPSEMAPAYTSTLPFVMKDHGLLLSILRHSGVPAAKDLFDKLALSIRRKGERVRGSLRRRLRGAAPRVPAGAAPCLSAWWERAWRDGAAHGARPLSPASPAPAPAVPACRP